MAAALLPVAFILAFISVVLLVQTSANLLFARQDRAKRLNRRLALHDAGLTRQQVYTKLARGSAGGAPALVGGINKRLERALQLAGLTISVQRFLLIVAAVAVALWVLSISVWSRNSGPLLGSALTSLLASLTLAALGAFLWLQRLRRTRLKKIELQMPIALDVMTRALRAGHPVISAIQLAADEMGDPLGSEFGLVIDENTYGIDLPDALANFADRTGSSDAYYLAVSVAVQTETGGNLSDILEGLAAVIRGRTSLTLKVKALSSEGRTSALLLTALPILAVSIQFMFQPQIYISKFSDPIFWPAVGATLAVYFAGWLWIQRIINFKY